MAERAIELFRARRAVNTVPNDSRDADSRNVDAFFVYGTLKRGECRCGLWPRRPRHVLPAWTHATLWDRPDYPCITTGHHRVEGQLWRFLPDDVDEVRRRLDQIEGTGQPGEADLYHRRVVDVWAPDENLLGRAWAYFYAGDPVQDGFRRVESVDHESVRWPIG